MSKIEIGTEVILSDGTRATISAVPYCSPRRYQATWNGELRFVNLVPGVDFIVVRSTRLPYTEIN